MNPSIESKMNALHESLFQVFLDGNIEQNEFKPDTRVVFFSNDAKPKGRYDCPLIPRHIQMIVFDRHYTPNIRMLTRGLIRTVYVHQDNNQDMRGIHGLKYYLELPGEDRMTTLKRLYAYSFLKERDEMPKAILNSHQEYRDAVTESVNKYVEVTSRSAIDKIMNQRDLVLCSEISLARYVKSKETVEELRELFSKPFPKEHMHVVKNLTGCYELVLTPDLL